MNTLFWLVVLALAGFLAWTAWYVRQRLVQRRHAEEARLAAFVSQVVPPAPPPGASAAEAAAPAAPAAADDLGTQKLLFEAARKAGDAGEAALAIQLYARLLARFPATGLADPARTAVAALKKKIAKA